jgi:hypothetical protein
MREDGGGVTNVQYKLNQNCDYESPMCNQIYPNKNFFKKVEIRD